MSIFKEKLCSLIHKATIADYFNSVNNIFDEINRPLIVSGGTKGIGYLGVHVEFGTI
jgi:hypothetical protein